MVLRFFKGGGEDQLEHVQSKLLEMLANDRHSFDAATAALLDGADPAMVGPNLAATDKQVNEAEREVRRQLVVHASVHGTSQVTAMTNWLATVTASRR